MVTMRFSLSVVEAVGSAGWGLSISAGSVLVGALMECVSGVVGVCLDGWGVGADLAARNADVEKRW